MPTANQRARTLRRNLTEAEDRLWSFLRNRAFMGYKFRRQHPVGPYIVDFVCLSRRLVVELDGKPHRASKQYDRTRDRFLAAKGFRVQRFWNQEILVDPQSVLRQIKQKLKVVG